MPITIGVCFNQPPAPKCGLPIGGRQARRYRRHHEGQANLPTQQASPREGAWISRANGHQERPARAQTAPSTGAQAPDRRRRALGSRPSAPDELDGAPTLTGPATPQDLACAQAPRVRARVLDWDQATRRADDGLRCGHQPFRRSLWRCRHQEARLGRRTKSRQAARAGSLQTPQGRDWDRCRDRAEAGDARCRHYTDRGGFPGASRARSRRPIAHDARRPASPLGRCYARSGAISCSSRPSSRATVASIRRVRTTRLRPFGRMGRGEVRG
jgi:hypothetical protein